MNAFVCSGYSSIYMPINNRGNYLTAAVCLLKKWQKIHILIHYVFVNTGSLYQLFYPDFQSPAKL